MAAADDADPDHERCAALLQQHPGPLVTTPLVVAEVGWLLDRQLGAMAEARFYRSVRNGDLAVEELTEADWGRIADLVETYANLRLGGTDASLVAVAERQNLTQLATLDRRDFSVVRPRHVEAFVLLP